MHQQKRFEYILNTANEHGFVSISETAKFLDVSTETIRRDINKLTKNAQLKKIRGGATSLKPKFRTDPEYQLRNHYKQYSKLSIGAEAAKMIQDNSVVAFAVGTSIEAVASSIHGVHGVTLVTSSLDVATILLEKIKKGDIDGQVIFVGGILDVENRFAKGTAATDWLDKTHFNLAFISCTAANEDGVYTYDLEECNYDQHLIERSACSVLLAERDKLNKASTHTIAPFGAFNALFTDNSEPLPKGLLNSLEASNVKLTIAEI